MKGGLALKKNLKTYAFLLIVIITAITILDNLKVSDAAGELQENRDKLELKVARLEKELETVSNAKTELLEDNKGLEENLLHLEEEVKALKSSVATKDFNEAVAAIESFKSKQTFKETMEFLAASNGIGTSTLDREGNCPCSFAFQGDSIEWMPNAILDLQGFSIEKEKILLTYNTVNYLEHDYQFVMAKEAGWKDSTKKWRIEGITLLDKETN
jgi:uncharacterized coiled-coil protein SlyX